MDTPAYKNLIDTIEANKQSDASKEAKRKAFFDAATRCWNEDVAGDVVLVTGQVVTIETI